MLNKKLLLSDLESVDNEFYNSVMWIKDNNIDECAMDLYFVADYELLGEIKTHELKEGGSDVAVTESNKEEYIELLVQWRFNRGVEQQTKAFFKGFTSVFPLEWLQYFDERELELLLCGMQDIDVADWQRHTVYRHYAPQSKQVSLFLFLLNIFQLYLIFIPLGIVVLGMGSFIGSGEARASSTVCYRDMSCTCRWIFGTDRQ